MALTKITGQVVDTTTDLVVGVTTVGGGVSAVDGFFSGIITAVGDASFSGNVSVGGTLTYEDVTNIDAVGLVTARNGIVVGSGITLSKDGDGFFTGIVTATSFVGSGAELTGVASTENIRTNTNATFLQNVSIVGTSTVTGNIVPSSDSATDIGTNSVRFQNAYVDNYYGSGANLTGINADVVDDTSPQLGGDLDTNTKNIKLGDSGTPGASGDDTLIFGADDDMRMYHDGSNGYLSNNTGAFVVQDSHAGANAIIVRKGAEVELMHNNSQKFETTSYGTHVTGYQTSSSYIGFHVVGQLNDHGFGTNHGSGITNFDIDYYSPIPMFGSKTIQSGSSYLSFPSYASGNYVKFTAPVSGLYQLELMASVETHHGGDWCAFGWELNTTTVSSDGDLSNNGLGILAVYERAGGDEGMGCHFSTTIYMAANDYAILYQQSTAAVRWKGNQYYVRGHLIH